MSSSSNRSLQFVGEEFLATIAKPGLRRYFGLLAFQFVAWKGVISILGPLSRFTELIVFAACVGLVLLFHPWLGGVALAACREALMDGPLNNPDAAFLFENMDAVLGYFIPLIFMLAHQLLRGYYRRLGLLVFQYFYIKSIQYLWPYPVARSLVAKFILLGIWFWWPWILSWGLLAFMQGIKTLWPLMKEVRPAAIKRVLMESSPRESTLPRYAYNKLAGREIRLLHLRPFFGLGVWCSLEIHDLDSAPQFEAISYRWGSGDLTHFIRINGCLLPIQKSAFDVLSSRISLWWPRRVWIDAICINQDDTSEKNVQVNLMRDIYSTAARTVAWLGHAPDARDIARLIFQSLDVNIKAQNAPGLEGTRPTKPPKYAAENEKMWGSLDRMLGIEYWERVWIIQEVAVSKQLDIWYGGLWFDWKTFSAVVVSLDTTGDGTLQKLDREYGMSTPPFWGIKKLRALAGMRERYGNGRLWSLARVIANFAAFQATDDRDRVFAVKGVSAAMNERDIATEYGQGKTALAVFEEAVRVSLVNGPAKDRFILLALAGISRTKDEVGEWPSWIPDLGQLPKHLLTAPSAILSDYAPYEASGNSNIQAKSPQGLGGNRHVIIRASVIDSIAHITKLEPSPFDFSTIFQNLGDAGSEEQRNGSRRALEMVERHKEALALAESCCETTYFNGQSRWEAFWRTQLCNVSSPDHYPAEESFGEAYRTHMRELEDVHSAALNGTPTSRSKKLASIVEDALTGSPEDVLSSLDRLILDPDFGSVHDYLTVDMLKDRFVLLEEYLRLVSMPKQTADDLRYIFRQLDQIIRGGGASAFSDFQLPPQPRLEEAISQLLGSDIDPSEPPEMLKRKFWTMMALQFSLMPRRLDNEQIAAYQHSMDDHIRAADTKFSGRLSLLLAATTFKMQFAVTSEKYMALVPPGTHEGDIVAIFHGAKTPHVLRRHGGEDGEVGRFKLVGEAYLHGFMDGEGFESREAVDICLV